MSNCFNSSWIPGSGFPTARPQFKITNTLNVTPPPPPPRASCWHLSSRDSTPVVKLTVTYQGLDHTGTLTRLPQCQQRPSWVNTNTHWHSKRLECGGGGGGGGFMPNVPKVKLFIFHHAPSPSGCSFPLTDQWTQILSYLRWSNQTSSIHSSIICIAWADMGRRTQTHNYSLRFTPTVKDCGRKPK